MIYACTHSFVRESVGAPKSTGGGYEKRDQGLGEINEFFHNKEIMDGDGCALQERVKNGIWVFHYFYTQALGAFVCVSVYGKGGGGKKTRLYIK